MPNDTLETLKARAAPKRFGTQPWAEHLPLSSRAAAISAHGEEGGHFALKLRRSAHRYGAEGTSGQCRATGIVRQGREEKGRAGQGRAGCLRPCSRAPRRLSLPADLSSQPDPARRTGPHSDSQRRLHVLPLYAHGSTCREKNK